MNWDLEILECRELEILRFLNFGIYKYRLLILEDVVLEELPKKGIKNLLIACPAFVSDCLETLEEIAERGKEIFMNAGGENYEMIPCMNTQPKWVQAVKELIQA